MPVPHALDVGPRPRVAPTAPRVSGRPGDASPPIASSPPATWPPPLSRGRAPPDRRPSSPGALGRKQTVCAARPQPRRASGTQPADRSRGHHCGLAGAVVQGGEGSPRLGQRLGAGQAARCSPLVPPTPPPQMHAIVTPTPGSETFVVEMRCSGISELSLVRAHAQSRAHIESPRAWVPYIAGWQFLLPTELRTDAPQTHRKRYRPAYCTARLTLGYAAQLPPPCSAQPARAPELAR